MANSQVQKGERKILKKQYTIENVTINRLEKYLAQ